MKKMNSRNSLFLSALVAFSFGFTSCNEDEPMPQPNIIEVASANNNFTTLVTAIQTAGLVPTLTGTGPFTVFAPTNDAFGRFLGDNNLTADALLSASNLGTVLTYHVIGGAEVRASDVVPGKVTSAANLPFYISVSPAGEVWINGSSKVVQTDVDASNGVIHVLDYVITPPSQNIAEIATASANSAS